MRKLTHAEIVSRQKKKMEGQRLAFTVILNNVRSLYNVGSIFRTADGVGVEKIFLCGITGSPPHKQISKTALGAENQIPWEYREDVISVIHELKEQGYQILLLEQIENSIWYDEFKPTAPICLVIGNEITGISDQLISYCDQAIEIEMQGLKNSLNVAVAFGIVAYHFRTYLKNSVPALTKS